MELPGASQRRPDGLVYPAVILSDVVNGRGSSPVDEGADLPPEPLQQPTEPRAALQPALREIELAGVLPEFMLEGDLVLARPFRDGFKPRYQSVQHRQVGLDARSGLFDPGDLSDCIPMTVDRRRPEGLYHDAGDRHRAHR